MLVELTLSRRLCGSAAAVAADCCLFQGMATWHPLVTASRGDGEGIGARRVFVAGGAEVEEQLTGRGEHAIAYTIVRSPHPISSYSARVVVTQDGADAVVTWDSSLEVDPEHAAPVKAGFEAFYAAGLDGLVARHG